MIINILTKNSNCEKVLCFMNTPVKLGGSVPLSNYQIKRYLKYPYIQFMLCRYCRRLIHKDSKGKWLSTLRKYIRTGNS